MQLKCNGFSHELEQSKDKGNNKKIQNSKVRWIKFRYSGAVFTYIL